MGKTAQERTKEEIIAEVRRELQAGRGKLTNAEIFDLLARIPRNPNVGSSADIIRELRGPLPDDDPDFKNVDRR
jgi:hypothetical protein